MNLKSIVNDKSLTFVNKWLTGCKMIDICNRREEESWVYLLYQEEQSDSIQVASLAKKDSSCEPSFFGTLSHLIKCMAFEAIPNGHIYPYSNEVYAKTVELEKQFIRLYNLPEDYFWNKTH